MKKHNLLLLLILVCLLLSACDSSDYNKACKQFENGDYGTAQTSFEALGDYKDSANMVIECRYQLALMEVTNGLYESAAAHFEALGDYKDSCEQVSVCNYYLGASSMDDKDWDAAINFFSNSTYQDSIQLLAECQKEKGMHDNADYAFLDDIVKSVDNREKMVSNNDSLSAIVNAELAILQEYSNQSFYDKNLQKIAAQYLDGLRLQKEALSLKYSDYQIKWSEGLVMRYDSLCELYEQYDLFDGEADFVNTYLAQVEDQRRLLNAIKSIDIDLVTQLDGIVFDYVDSYTMSAPYTNNTAFDFDIWFYFTFYDEDGVRVDESQEYFSNIISGDVCTLNFYHPDGWSTCEFNWEITVY